MAQIEPADIEAGVQARRVGRIGDVFDQAAFGAGAVQRPLRPLQHFHALQIERIDIGGKVGARGAACGEGQRHVIDDARSCARRARRTGVEAADDDALAGAVAAALEAQARHARRQVLEIEQLLPVQLVAADRGDRQRHVLDTLFALVRGDDDVVGRRRALLVVGWHSGWRGRGLRAGRPRQRQAQQGGAQQQPRPLHPTRHARSPSRFSATCWSA